MLDDTTNASSVFLNIFIIIEIKTENILKNNMLNLFFNLKISIYIIPVDKTKYKLSAPAHPFDILSSTSSKNKLLL